MSNIYKVYDYDVWVNDEGSFEVNDIHAAMVGTSIFNARNVYVRILQDYTNDQIIKALKMSGYLNKKLHYKGWNIEGESEYTLFIYKDDRPVCELRHISDEDCMAIIEEQGSDCDNTILYDIVK